MWEGSRRGKARKRNMEMSRTKNILKLMVRLTLLASVGFAAFLSLAQTDSALAATAPFLGAAQSFGVLGNSGVSVNGAATTTITGDVGSSPTVAVTGFPPGVVAPGFTLYLAGEVPVQQAQVANVVAYNDLAAQPCTSTIAGGLLGGLTLVPGVYCVPAATTNLTGTLTLDGPGVYIFKMASTLITAGASTVNLINGADSCNVFWQVGSSATLGAASTFRGNILANQSISMGTTITLVGRALAGGGADPNGAVTFAGGGTVGGCSGPAAVVPPSGGVALSKGFSPATITPGGVSTLTITLSNNIAAAAILTSPLTDTLLGGLVIAPTPNASTTCTGGTLTADAGTTMVTLSAGNSIPAPVGSIPGTCRVTVDVTAPLAGSYSNTLAAGSLVIGNVSNGAPASATLTVNAPLASATAVPTLSEWGAIIFMMLAGLGSVYFLRRRRV